MKLGSRRILLALFLSLWCSSQVWGQTTRPAYVYPVGRFILDYAYDHPGQPPLGPAMEVRVSLAEQNGLLVAPEAGGTPIALRLADVTPEHPRKFAWSGIEAVSKAVVTYLNDRGLIGVHVGPEPDAIDVDIDRATGLPVAGKDLRKNTDMKLLVRTAAVSAVRTVAQGDVGKGPRVNNPREAFILKNSPLQPNGALLRRDILDDYIYRLNRYPGRHVDAALSAGENVEQGQVSLDYLVSEAKPWTVYAQLSNTGTKETDPWRERFGFIDNQLTGHDDIFSIDYVTAGFSESHAVLTSYEAPLDGLRKVRWRVHGSWDEFTASDVGQANANFEGHEETGGADLIFNIFQHKQTFVDLVAGARYQHVHVDNKTGEVTGDEDFFLPHVGLQLERNGDTSSTFAAVDLEGNLASVADTDSSQVNQLGRSDVDREWVVLTANVSHSFFLEPLLNHSAWEKADYAHPENSSHWATLAHELYFSGRAQYAFDQRLIPQAQGIAGGFYTVRGYSEAEASGDSLVMGTAEYRWHIPRGFRPEPNPQHHFLGQPFRVAPQQPYGQPDWDLIFRGFIDAAQTWNSSPESFEHDQTLIGTGVGLELDLKRNLRLRVDWGVALHDTPETDAGSNRFHIEFTLTY